MAKFNRSGSRAAVSSPVKTEARPSGVTYEGAPGYARDAKSELFLLAVANMVGEDTFYEKAGDRDDRYRALVRQVALDDPLWLTQMLTWLRSEGNMRSAPIVGACEMVKARLEAAAATPPHAGSGAPAGPPDGARRQRDLNRRVIDAVCRRADEPGELLAYWTAAYGRAIPKPVKRGLADAVRRLYDERSLLKYDTGSRGFRFGDVVELVHPSPDPGKPWQGALFAHAIDRRRGRAGEPEPGVLGTIARNAAFLKAAAERPELLLDADALHQAGLTWENALSLAGSRVDKARLWEALIPSMGYMALLRNLRNFDEAGVSDEVAERVAARLADPEQVARSRQFPFRFFSAHLAAPSLRWSHALDKALTAATANVPPLPGRTLVLVDTSASMTSRGVSGRSKMTYAQMAALFGVTLAARGDQVDLCGFANGTFGHRVRRGASVLREVERLVRRIGEVGHGTDIAGAVRATYRGQDRVIILSDMQTFGGTGGVADAAPQHVPMYGFNLAGYRHAAMPTGRGTRHELGGMTDATFRLIPLLEAGRDADWPWL
jgi:hypothetical protein